MPYTGKVEEGGQVLDESLCYLQACVPEDWTTEQIETWANSVHVAGTKKGWNLCLTKEDMSGVDGEPRVQCALDPKKVHVILAC